jgi:channel protein (hemolysin III family)
MAGASIAEHETILRLGSGGL